MDTMEEKRMEPDVEISQADVLLFVEQHPVEFFNAVKGGPLLVRIKDEQQFTTMNGLLLQVKSQKKTIETRLEKSKKKAWAAYQEWLILIKEVLDPLSRFEEQIKGGMQFFRDEQERARIQKIQDVAASRNQKAEVFKMAGDETGAQAMKNLSQNTAQEFWPRDPGWDRRMFKPTYKAEVRDLRALVQAWLEGKVPPESICANQVFLDQQARDTREAIEKNFPGVSLVTTKPGGLS